MVDITEIIEADDTVPEVSQALSALPPPLVALRSLTLSLHCFATKRDCIRTLVLQWF